MRLWKRVIKVVIVIGILLTVPNINGRVYAYVWVDGTPQLYEEGRSLARVPGYSDGAMRAPALAGVSRPPAYNVGGTRGFYALDMRTERQYLLEASCQAISDHAYIFVENGRTVSPDRIKSLLESFSRIYDTIVSQFGPPSDKIDNDPRVYLLIMDILDGSQVNGVKMLGYFSPIDQFTNAQLIKYTKKRSNEINILYIDYVSLTVKGDLAEGVIAHEFTHLVEWSRDPEESTWVNEGIAMYAESMMGYEVDDYISAFEKNPAVSLLDWSESIENYGAVYLFFAYISEKFGGVPAIAAIVKNGDQGAAGIEKAMAMPFEKIFSNWIIANYLDRPDLNNGIYGYSTLDIHLKPTVVETTYPVARKTSRIYSWTAQYIEFDKSQTDILRLTIYDDSEDGMIAAQIIKFGTEDKVEVLSVKSSGEPSGNASIAQENARAILVVASQPDPPDTKNARLSYAYSAETRSAGIAVAPLGKKITTWGSVKRD